MFELRLVVAVECDVAGEGSVWPVLAPRGDGLDAASHQLFAGGGADEARAPEHERPRHLLYVPGDEVDVDPVDRAQPVGHLGREHDRPMAPAGAPERDHQVHAALFVIQRHQVGDHPMQVVQQPGGGRLAQHELRYRGVVAGPLAQLRNPVRVVQEASVDQEGGVGGRAVLVAESEACDQGPFAAAKVLRELEQLARLDPMVRALIGASRVTVTVALVDQHVLEADAVGVAQKLGAATGYTEHRVALRNRRHVAQASKAGGLENLEVVVEVVGCRGSQNDEGQSVSFNRRASFSGTPTATMSSTGASRIPCTDPNWRRSARLRAGPMPSIESSGDDSALRDRTLR